MLADVTHTLATYQMPEVATPSDAEEPDTFLAEYRRRLADGYGGRLAWRSILRQLPVGCPLDSGHLYACQWTTGVVKVGWTQDPRTRMGSHVADARRRGADVFTFWVSIPFYGFQSAEAVLIEMCAEVGSRVKGEYFHDIDYSQVVKIADQIVGAQITLTGRPAPDAEAIYPRWQRRS